MNYVLLLSAKVISVTKITLTSFELWWYHIDLYTSLQCKTLQWLETNYWKHTQIN